MGHRSKYKNLKFNIKVLKESIGDIIVTLGQGNGS